MVAEVNSLYMGDGSRSFSAQSKETIIQSLIKEWNLFWATITEDSESEKELELPEGTLQNLSLTQVQEMLRALSSDRKSLNLEMEILNEKLDEENQRLEELKSKNEPTEACMHKLDLLHDFGQKLNEALMKIDERIKEARQQEQNLLGLDKEG